jgi:plasmid maintenance system antidote protein VapI
MTLQDVVRQAIASAPRSLRALARAARVSHVTLLRIRDGDELVSARVAARLARVLDTWAAEHAREAAKLARSCKRIRTALRGSKGEAT